MDHPSLACLPFWSHLPNLLSVFPGITFLVACLHPSLVLGSALGAPKHWRGLIISDVTIPWKPAPWLKMRQTYIYKMEMSPRHIARRQNLVAKTVYVNTISFCLKKKKRKKMILGWPKRSFRFFHKIVWKNPNEYFGQPNI